MYICNMKTKYTKDILESIVINSETISEVVRKITKKDKVHGSMIAFVKAKLIKYDIDFSHFKGNKWCLGKINPTGVAITKNEFIENYLGMNPKKKTSSSRFKSYLFKFGLKVNSCEKCSVEDLWNGVPIINQLDHIDGNTLNNKLENLRILCPNCHSQTPTFTGRNNGGSQG